MDLFISLLERLGQAGISLLLNPFYYISILIVVLQIRRMIFFERRLYHSRLHSMLGETVRIVLWGLLAGFIGSLGMVFLGAYLQPMVVIYLWIGALLLAAVRVRFLCFAYIIGLIGVVQAVLGWIPAIDGEVAWARWIEPITELHMPSLLALVGILHMMESLLVRLQGERLATPVFVEGKRGKLVGSYQFQGLWPVPLLLMVPGMAGGQALPLTPLFGGSALWSEGWMFLAMPIMIGFTDMTTSMTARQKIARSSAHLLLYGIIITALAVASEWLPVLVLPASLLTIVLHEAIIWYAGWIENSRSPLYVHDPHKGLTVLAILPNSPAQTMGISAGEILHKVNGMKVRTKEELHQAIRLNPAFTRLEVIDLRGERRFVQRALFEGEHHQLGIILSPDDDAEWYVKEKRFQKFRELRKTLGKQWDPAGQQDGPPISG